MERKNNKHERRIRRHVTVRKTVSGTPERPRLAVYKSLKHIYVQVIDDLAGRTLAAASTHDVTDGAAANKSGATAVGKLVAERAKAAGVQSVAFDRGGFKFHGRIKALADAAREGGLKF